MPRPKTNIQLIRCQMASSQRKGHTCDSHGAGPDVTLRPVPSDALLDVGRDPVPAAALARLRGTP